MRHAPRPGSPSPAATLSRLLVVLALALFGPPQGQANGAAAEGGPAARSQIEQVQGIPSVQRHLLRAQLPDDASPDALVPGVALRAAPPSPTGIVAAPHPARVTVAIGILPPVRGPPAA